MNILLQIIYKCSEWFMYIISYLVNELHLNYFVMILTILITTIITCLMSLVLKLFGINDSIENDKKILKTFLRTSRPRSKNLGNRVNLDHSDLKMNENENENENKLIFRYNK